MFRAFMTGSTLLALASTAFAQVNGSKDSGEYGAAIAVQNTPTGFGDNFNELNAAYALINKAGLRLLITGNMEGSGNGIVIFFDTRAGGCIASTLGNGYGVIGSIGGSKCDDWGTDQDGSVDVNGGTGPNAGSILDPGFNPDFALEMNDFAGTTYTNAIDMTVPNEPSDTRDVYLGSVLSDGSSALLVYGAFGAPIGFGGTMEIAFNNTNTGGVFGYDFGSPPGALGDPAGSTTGLEIQLDPTFLNLDSGCMKILIFLTNGGGDFLSNQFLPGLAGETNLGGRGNPGGDPMLFDAQVYSASGPYYIEIGDCGGDPCPEDCSGDGFRDQADLALLLSCYDGGPCCDIDGDGFTTQADLAALLAVYDVACP